ncbi:MAG: ABC transporter substrate-binding protein [Proteobacteria bacterium]|nr:ABC transporter substrate-binding protein [Pseudomonadota bacterium]
MRRVTKFVLSAAIAVGLTGTAAAQTLLVLAEDVPAGLNVDGASIAIPTTQTGVDNLMEPLLYFKSAGKNEDGVGIFNFNEFEGRLAESWSFDASTITWTLNLRRGVKGCNGATFNADDVIYSFERGKSVSGSAPIVWFLSNVASFDKFTPDVFGDSPEAIEAKKLGDEIKKIDDYTVEFRQSAPNKLFLPVLTIFGLYIFDKELMEAQATDDDPWSQKYTDNVGLPSFGPWCLQSWEKGKDFVVTANPDYYRGAPAIDRVIYRKVPQSSNRVVILRSGQAQLVEHLTPKEFDSLRKARGVKVAGHVGNENLFIHMNFKTPPFDNIKVRQAIAHAIPYDRIIRDGYFGQATKWTGQIPSSYPGFHRSDIQYEFNIEKAKALLAEAGFPGGAGLEAFKGAFDLAYVAEKESTLGPIATTIRTALAEIGISVNLNPLPQTQYGDRQLVKKDLPFALNDQEKPIGVDAGYATQLFFVTSEKGGLNNMVNFSNDTLDEVFAKVKVEGDEKVRDQMLAQIQDILAENVVWLPVVEFKTQWAFSDKLKGVTWHADNSIRWYDLSFE